MTIEQFREFEKKPVKRSADKEDVSLVKLLEEAEESKYLGLVFSKEEVFNLFEKERG